MRAGVVLIAAALLLGPGVASAELFEQGERFMSEPPKETVYATEHHMGFSMRASIIEWLGGVPIVDEQDLRAARRERWWGEDVPLLPPDAVKTSQ